MSSKTLYKCDRCKEESWEREALDLMTVCIGLSQSFSSYSVSLVDGAKRKSEMCLKCRRELGVVITPKEKGEPEPTYPTLEEMIREIIRDEMGGQS